ncbi:glycosyltransferase family 2 protein [Ichthyenterobacterium magnum]|uniref:GT2 family glycosyltransferase n=1 Tax=Ichthyenterobacterium magnum TaxID=1230530 RepID=A0A420DUQ9_9FLAO|nr:glycosyltransferase family 2 protein [Ichthyenterobacterium magnum]RKE97985.1 GT2 family glycosyltransferase [Ichthyenterobacterium magnum]
MVDVSIIFVNYNTCKLTCDAIQSVYDFTKNIVIELILVDNNSKDDSVVVIKKKFPEVKVIANKQNLGFGKANNKGIKIANGKYLFLLNTDTYLINNAIELLYNFMENAANKNVSVAGAQLLTPDLLYNVSAGNFPNFRLFVKGSFWKYFYSKHYYLNANRRAIPTTSNIPFVVDYVSGADFFVRKRIIDEVGGFDKRFFMYGEDTELSYRIKTYFPEMESMIVPAAKIVHISQGSSANDSESKPFKHKLIKGRTLYYRITEGILPSVLYYITSIKRLYF